MNKSRPEQIQQIILELITGAGTEYSETTIVSKILPLYLRKLNCFAALMYKVSAGSVQNRFSVPVSFQKTPAFHELDTRIQHALRQKNQPDTEYQQESGSFYCFELPDYGYLLLARTKPMNTLLMAELQQALRHLARSLCYGDEIAKRRQAEQQVQQQHDQLATLLNNSNELNSQLRFAESRYRSVMLSALDCIIVSDHDGRIMEWNPAAELVFGWKRSEVIGTRMSQTIIPPHHRDAHQRGMRNYLATGEGPVLGRRIEITALRKSGEEFPIELAITPVQSLGFPIFIAYLRDISGRKAAEAEIKNQSTRLTSILKNIGDGVIVLNADNQVMLINPTARILLGLGDQDVKSVPLTEWFPGDSDSLVQALAMLNPGQSDQIDVDLVHPETRILSFVATNFTLESDGHMGKILVFRDVTREREVDRMKTEFVSQVSHELRTPLTSIIGFTQTIREDREMPADIRDEFLRIIHDESKRLSNLIDNILSLSKIESGTLQLDRRLHDAGILVREIVQTYSILMDQKQLKLNLESPDQPVMMYADRDSITVVLVNLLSNAIKFTESGGTISIRLGVEPDSIRISISDTGIGIPKKDLHRIFEKFYRSTKVKNVIKGSGLGLSIVKKLVDEHQGIIEVTSEEWKGTTFMIQLPSTPVSEGESE